MTTAANGAQAERPGFLAEDVDDDDEDDFDVGGHQTAAFERQYLDEHSWEDLKEDEHGRLIAAQSQHVKRKRMRSDDAGRRVRRGLIRYMQLVLDMSETCAASTDMPPNRAVALVSMSKKFVTEFFDQNPLSQLGISIMRHGRVYSLSDLSASPEAHKRALEGSIQTGGEVSLQNMLEHVCQGAAFIPPYGHRECLVLLSSLTTCDPGRIADALQAAKNAHIRVSIIGLSAEMFIGSKIAKETSGRFDVALSEVHLRELIMNTCTPPAVQGAALSPSLVRMAFPTKDATGARNATYVGAACEVAGGAFTCPVCKAKNPSVPCECHVCGVTLILSPHLARSFHHLFPVPEFEEVALDSLQEDRQCDTCDVSLRSQSSLVGPMEAPGAFKCPSCGSVCCNACDAFIHEHLHNCPGCECMLTSQNDA